jgi:hypothetical protein
VHFLVHFCSKRSFFFGASVPYRELRGGNAGSRLGGRNGIPETKTRGIRVTGMLAWQRVFNGLERIVCSQQRFSCWR